MMLNRRKSRSPSPPGVRRSKTEGATASGVFLNADTSENEPTTASAVPLPPSPTGSDDEDEKKKKQKPHKDTRQKKRSLWLIFTAGGILGLLLAGVAAKHQNLDINLNLDLLRELSLENIINLDLLRELSLENIIDVIPAGILKEASDITQREKDAVKNYDAFSTGLALAAQGFGVQHPVVMMPGVISTGLESWGTAEKSRPYFRKRLWGSWTMLRAMIMDRAGWKEHIMLDKITGLDPPGGIKLRAAMGFDATDFFVTGYWIWSKILENLASIGYDPTSAYTASYDWRLAYGNLEVRDAYFSRLKLHIETAKKVSGKKVALVAHSMGSQGQ
jgi:phospholipid:diacylglycerol acyltransferase